MSLVVKQIQEKVGVTADGIWGPKTQAAVAAKLGVENMPGSIQRAVGAKVDGIIGEKTHAAILEKLGGHKEAPKSFEVKHIFVDPGHTSDYGREHPAQFTAVDWSIGKAKKVADLLGFKRETNDSIEHILNVKIAKAFTKHLEARGIKVTYYDDPSLSNNAEISQVYRRANASDADLLVSIHNNAAGASGWKSLNCKASGSVGLYKAGSIKGRLYADKLTDAITSLRKRTSGPDNRANHSMTSTVAVLTKSTITACLIEVGFYDNIEDLLWMAEHVDEIGASMANCI